MKTIYTRFLNYATKRNFSGLDMEPYIFKTKLDIVRIFYYPFFKYFKLKESMLIKNIFIDLFGRKNNFYHFLNTVYFGTGKWIVTFEDVVPRFGIANKWIIRFGLKQLSKENCKALIALSQNTYNRQLYILNQYPDLKDSIERKLYVLHPSQSSNGFDISQKKYNYSCLRFVFVGRFFFHKGGLEILRAFDKLIEEGFFLKLTIVGSFEKTNWLDNHITNIEVLETKELFKKNIDFIDYFKELPNNEVLELFKKSDIGLLPSYGETYGYSVLEAQSFGCPVITTNIWAFEEINNDEKGWLVNVPRKLEEGGYIADVDTYEKNRNFSIQLEDGIYKIVKGILKNPEIVSKKGNLAFNDIRIKHNPDYAIDFIQKLYN